MVCKEEIKGQVQMFLSDVHSSPWESFSYLITQIAPFYLKNTRDKPHCLLATEDHFATLQPYPIHPKVWCVPVSGPLGWLLSTLSHKHPGWAFGQFSPTHLTFSFLPIQMQLHLERWVETLWNILLVTLDSKNNWSSSLSRTSTICTVLQAPIKH